MSIVKSLQSLFRFDCVYETDRLTKEDKDVGILIFKFNTSDINFEFALYEPNSPKRDEWVNFLSSYQKETSGELRFCNSNNNSKRYSI